jgi:hypothetical protein
MHENNCFLTLTYDEENVPEDGCLEPRDYKLFLKKLRKYIAPYDRDWETIIFMHI